MIKWGNYHTLFQRFLGYWCTRRFIAYNSSIRLLRMAWTRFVVVPDHSLEDTLRQPMIQWEYLNLLNLFGFLCRCAEIRRRIHRFHWPSAQDEGTIWARRANYSTLQRWSWPNGSIHLVEYRARAHAVWGSVGCFPNSANTAIAAASHGSNWSKFSFASHVLMIILNFAELIRF